MLHESAEEIHSEVFFFSGFGFRGLLDLLLGLGLFLFLLLFLLGSGGSGCSSDTDFAQTFADDLGK